MKIFIFPIFIAAAIYFFYLFITGKNKYSPLWLMLSAWMMGIGIPQLNLSDIENPWSLEYWLLVGSSLVSFGIGYWAAKKWIPDGYFQRSRILARSYFSAFNLRVVIYVLFLVSVLALFMFNQRAGDFPLLAADTDVFRFVADEQVPGLINYTAQFARLFIPLAFFLMFYEGFGFKRHWDLVLISLFGAFSLILFASRTQIFFIDLWVMALYLFMRKPTMRQAVKFYPFFLLVSVLVLAVVPFYRQYKSYGTTDYLAGVTAIHSENYNPIGKALLPIYVGVSFNQQSLLHAQEYYENNPIQKGKVTLDPFTNIVGLDSLKSDFNLCNIFQCWWNTGTYLFPFVQDFGTSAFFFVPAIIAGLLAWVWRYWKAAPNFLSINLYAYACFFIVMSVYLSFTVRAEMYLDLFVLILAYVFVSSKKLVT